MDFKDPNEYLNNLLEEASKQKASDIHINPTKKGGEILFRINGALKLVEEIDSGFYDQIAYAAKKRAKVNPMSELPQDGRIDFFFSHSGKKSSLRFASIYSASFKKDKITLRLTDKDVSLLELDMLNFSKEAELKFKLSLKKSSGLILVTGPTGSGKTTTLYAALNYIKNQDKLNILTIEDPVEFLIPGTTQIEASSSSSFGEILKSFLRHDPDIIMIGEIRDKETAKVAVEASMTGHLVLATLHTNTALLAVSRLKDLGVDPYNLVFSLNAVSSQRLVKKLCDCKIETLPRIEEIVLWRKLKKTRIQKKFYKRNKEGCSKCNWTGISGRQLIYELITLDSEDQIELFKCITEKKSLESEYASYLKNKYKSKNMLELASEYVSKGVLDAQDVLRTAL